MSILLSSTTYSEKRNFSFCTMLVRRFFALMNCKKGNWVQDSLFYLLPRQLKAQHDPLLVSTLNHNKRKSGKRNQARIRFLLLNKTRGSLLLPSVWRYFFYEVIFFFFPFSRTSSRLFFCASFRFLFLYIALVLLLSTVNQLQTLPILLFLLSLAHLPYIFSRRFVIPLSHLWFLNISHLFLYCTIRIHGNQYNAGFDVFRPSCDRVYTRLQDNTLLNQMCYS